MAKLGKRAMRNLSSAGMSSAKFTGRTADKAAKVRRPWLLRHYTILTRTSSLIAPRYSSKSTPANAGNRL